MERTDVREAGDFTARGVLIERSILLVLVGGLLIGVLAILRPFATPILLGAVIATAAWPLRQSLVRRGLTHGIASMLLFLVALALVVVPIVVIVPHVADQLNNTIQHIELYFSQTPQRPAFIIGVPLLGRRLAAAWDIVARVRGNIRALMELYTADVEQWIVLLARAIMDSVLQVLSPPLR